MLIHLFSLTTLAWIYLISIFSFLSHWCTSRSWVWPRWFLLRHYLLFLIQTICINQINWLIFKILRIQSIIRCFAQWWYHLLVVALGWDELWLCHVNLLWIDLSLNLLWWSRSITVSLLSITSIQSFASYDLLRLF